MKPNSRLTLYGACVLMVTAAQVCLCAYVPDFETVLPKDTANAYQRFGESVAVDGEYAAVGAPGERSAQGTAGAVYLYRRSVTGWALAQKLSPPTDDLGTQFGAGIALQGDTLLVGGYLAAATTGDSSLPGAGAVYVYHLKGDLWEWVQTLQPGDTHQDQMFGFPVALDGDRMIVGAYGDDEAAADSGAAYVYRRVADVWVQEIKFKSPVPNNQEYFAWWVDLQGTTAVVSAPYASVEMDGTVQRSVGVIYVFEHDGSSWAPPTLVVSSQPMADSGFGLSVAVDGDTAVAGVTYSDSGAGAAEVFRRQGGLWSSEAFLEADDAEPWALLGFSVDLKGDTVMVGAPGDSHVAGTTLSGGGSVYVYERSGGGWSWSSEIASAARLAGEWSGWSVAFDGRNLVVGARMHAPPGGGSDEGVAYLFESNLAPRADASNTVTPVMSMNGVDATVTLDGLASTDPDGDALAFSWYEDGVLLGEGGTFAVVLGVGSHTVELRVTDGRADDSTTWIVAVQQANRPPVARAASAELRVTDDGSGGAVVTLDGSPSSDPDGDALTYWWSENGVELSTDAVADQRFEVGSHTVVLRVSDGRLDSTAEVTVVVDARELPEVNQPPVADASRTVQRVVSSDNVGAWVRLDASLSHDPEGDTLSYRWMVGGKVVAEGVVADVEMAVGVSTVRLEVSDGQAAAETTVVVRVLTAARATKSLMLNVLGADLPKGRKTAALASLKTAEWAFERGRTVLGTHRLQIFQHLLQVGRTDQEAAAPLIAEAQWILDAIDAGR